MTWNILGPGRDRNFIWIAFMLVSVTSVSGNNPNMDLFGTNYIFFWLLIFRTRDVCKMALTEGWAIFGRLCSFR